MTFLVKTAKRLFLHTYCTQLRIIGIYIFHLKPHKKHLDVVRRILIITAYILFVVFACMFAKTGKRIELLFIPLGMMFLDDIFDIPLALTSIKNFIHFNLSVLGILSLSIIIIILSLNNLYVLIIPLLVFIYLICWSYMSLLANSSVSLTANAVFSALFAIIIYIVSSVSTLFPIITTLNIEFPLDVFKDVVLLPFLLVNTVSIAFAQVKSYWTKKYNLNQQISNKDLLADTSEDLEIAKFKH